MKHRAVFLLIVAMLLAACTSEEGEIVFAGAQVAPAPAGESGDVLHISLTASMSEAVQEALHHGVPLSIVIEASAVRSRDWLPDEELANVTTRLSLSWRPMTEQYLVTTEATDTQLSVSARETAAGALRGPFRIPVPRVELGDDALWRVHAYLDLNALPSPLRLPAWFDSDWHMRSAWYAVPRRS